MEPRAAAFTTGFGTTDETNLRFKELLRSGGTGLSTPFDMPTLMAARATRLTSNYFRRATMS